MVRVFFTQLNMLIDIWSSIFSPVSEFFGVCWCSVNMTVIFHKILNPTAILFVGVCLWVCELALRARTFSRSTHSSSTSPCSLLGFLQTGALGLCGLRLLGLLQTSRQLLPATDTRYEHEQKNSLSPDVQKTSSYWIGTNLEHVTFGFDLEQTFSMCCSKHYRLGWIWFINSLLKSRFRVDFMYACILCARFV